MNDNPLLVYAVDDDPLFNRLIFSVLKKYGFTCQTFSSSDALLQQCRQSKPALCIVDMNIERANSGIDLIKALRTQVSPTMPVFIVSSDTETSVITHALEVGANDYLLKPLDRDVLISKLMGYFKTHELELAAMNFLAHPKAEFKATLEVDAKLVEIDELGLKIESKNLISKGTVISLHCKGLKEIIGRDKPLLVTAAATWVVAERENYGVYLEFDPTDKELTSHVRNWILQKTA
jgi:DNA-binding response OmpR family regulator